MTPDQIVKAAIPDASEKVVEHVLWGMTPFPCGPVTPHDLYRAASRLRRATANGVNLCDLCQNRAGPGKCLCEKCEALLNASRGVTRMRFIWKFSIPRDQTSVIGYGTGAIHSVRMPGDARIVSAAYHDSLICIWALVDDANPTEQRDIRIFSTGAPMDAIKAFDDLVFIGTVHDAGQRTFHVFEDRGAFKAESR